MYWLRNVAFELLIAGCCCSSLTTPPAPPAVEVTDVSVADVAEEPSPAPAPEPPPKKELKLVGRRILVIGDSEACAVNLYIRKTVKAINEAAGQPLDTVDVDCKGGTVVQYWGDQGHFREALRKHPNPDTVIIFLGTNHYWQGTRPPVESILDQIQAPTSCVWVGNTAVKGKRWKINNILREAVQPTCSYFDTEATGIELPDGVHPSGAGAIKWLKAIWPLIPLKYEEADE